MRPDHQNVRHGRRIRPPARPAAVEAATTPSPRYLQLDQRLGATAAPAASLSYSPPTTTNPIIRSPIWSSASASRSGSSGAKNPPPRKLSPYWSLNSRSGSRSVSPTPSPSISREYHASSHLRHGGIGSAVVLVNSSSVSRRNTWIFSVGPRSTRSGYASPSSICVGPDRHPAIHAAAISPAAAIFRSLFMPPL